MFKLNTPNTGTSALNAINVLLLSECGEDLPLRDNETAQKSKANSEIIRNLLSVTKATGMV